MKQKQEILLNLFKKVIYLHINRIAYFNFYLICVPRKESEEKCINMFSSFTRIEIIVFLDRKKIQRTKDPKHKEPVQATVGGVEELHPLPTTQRGGDGREGVCN